MTNATAVQLDGMHLFYSPDIADGLVTLSEEESRHCIRVLRFKKGDTIRVIDGKGGWYEATILEDKPQKCQAKITDYQQQAPSRNYRVHVAVAPPKNIARFEWFLEKATEIGIDEITPLVCERSERARLPMERLSRILVESMKQSLQTYLPQLNPPEGLATMVCRQYAEPLSKYIAYCTTTAKEHLASRYQQKGNALILIGPEGDFTEGEVGLAFSHHFEAVSLGENRLRTETAALVACHTVHLLNKVQATR